MSAQQSEPAFASRLLPLNGALDLGYAFVVDGASFGAERLAFSPECFAESIAPAGHAGPVGGIASRRSGDSVIFNDRLPITHAA